MPPRKGAVQKTQWLSQTPVMSAGPKARVGLMHMLLTEPSSHISSGTMRPTESGPSLPQPLQTGASAYVPLLGGDAHGFTGQSSKLGACLSMGAPRNIRSCGIR